MCGIYGLLSSRDVVAPREDEFFQALESVIAETRPEALASLFGEVGGDRVFERLEGLRALSSCWTHRGAMLALLSSDALVSRLRGTLARIEDWVRGLAAHCDDSSSLQQSQVLRQNYGESVNRMLLCVRDIAWELEKDVLGNLDSIRQLSTSTEPASLARAYELNMVLRSLDRLEVRGRDSAGIAIFVRFPGSGSLESFLDGPVGGAAWRCEMESRSDARLGHRSVLRPSAASETLLFVFKVASEVGKMGDNTAYLRRAIEEDQLFQAALAETQVEVQSLAHTRWASNGVVSVPNCHPVDASVRDAAGEFHDVGHLVACLNGDIDNYQALVKRYVTTQGKELDPSVTTDAKIIPIVVAHYLRETGDLEEAFCRAIEEFEGSMAIALMAADRPGQLLCAQKGSGQGLFLGLGGESIAVASEMYGLVELTPRYVKAEGESKVGGEIFRLTAQSRTVLAEVIEPGPAAPLDCEGRGKLAEITTRDINRGDYPHFFLKEISESVESIRKTLSGKFEITGGGQLRFLLGEDVLPVGLVAGLREGRVRHVYVVGQGTAAIAAQGVAHLLDVALARSPHSIRVVAEKATEFSAHRLRDDMSDTLVIAVSQSGTTTDTNRTVDMARSRGAWVLGIVNRRNSDLVYKSHGVLYTSDGRDIEMSVASTKAFYAQNVAGQVIALGLAANLGTLTEEELKKAASDLEALPSVMEKTLALGDHIAELAEEFSLARRYWAVVGSGASKVAADEIRIKLSELCYKSIAVDYTEDKKHIDLSSEPLILVCAAGQREEILSDAVKEVAIFKAHQAIPIVITDENEKGFGPYAAGEVHLPNYAGALSYLPTTMVGHLFGYHAAACMDRRADALRSLRAEVVRLREEAGFGEEVVTEILTALSRSAALEIATEFDDALSSHGLDGALAATEAVQLSQALQLILGRITIDGYTRARAEEIGVIDRVLAAISGAIAELSRPIDAIKHQAKTVTVGISRSESTPEGLLWRTVKELGLDRQEVQESHRIFLSALDPLVSGVAGVSLYRISGLDALGRPRDDSSIRVLRKLGCAEFMSSRSDAGQKLSGTKWAAIKHREIYLGFGQTDQRKILILPIIQESREGHLVLFHLELQAHGDRDVRLKALETRGRFFDRLMAAITERDLDWDPALIDAVDNDKLFLLPPERVAEELSHASV